MGKVFLSVLLEAEHTEESNNGSSYMEIKEFYKTKTAWIKRAKEKLEKKLQYIWQIIGKWPHFIKIWKSVRKEYTSRKTGKERDRQFTTKRKSSQYVYENISNLIRI